MNGKIKKLIILNVPYIAIGLLATNIGEAWRTADGANVAKKVQSLVLSSLSTAFANPMPSIDSFDLMFGIGVAIIMKTIVYVRGKSAKKYRHNVEYGSARWGTHTDIEPFEDPDFSNNVILSKTERITMNSRPSKPQYARNKNVLVVGGSGSGKTRFWLKPNLLQMKNCSYVVTDPKGSVACECGNALLKNGYDIKIFNTINFKKSMKYNPFAYVRHEVA